MTSQPAAKTAEQEYPPKNWLNGSVKGIIGPNAQAETFISIQGLQVLIGSFL
ncbi:MAG: hypothetical protein LBP22_16565 [Deltaproteobacteria bacterium]|nr:hypothetical protein [Deltaproteobacteria bacterium]